MGLKHQIQGNVAAKKAEKGQAVRKREEGRVGPVERLEEKVAREKSKNDFLRQAGEALYGKHWRSEMSHDLRVSRPTLHAWLEKGELAPEPYHSVCELLRARRDRLDELLGEGE